MNFFAGGVLALDVDEFVWCELDNLIAIWITRLATPARIAEL
jgi:hypothetical protein